MTQELFFPFADYWWFYAGFTLFVLLMLALDLGVFHRKAHEVSIKEATIWSVIWVALALAFNYGFYLYAAGKFPADPRLTAIEGFVPDAAAKQVALEFLTGYIVEKSLAVDNIFVFVVVFSFFAIPSKYQHRVLFYGIIGALVFRAIFIGMGSVLMQYKWVVVLFGALLILTGIKMFFAPERGIDPEKNPLIRLFKRFMPVTPQLHGQSFFVRLDGRMHATPLFVSLLFLEFSDVIFAVDSVPAIFALTREPLIVYTSNVFAILGLRAMYFLLAGAVDKFHMLKFGLALVLVFVGLKMVWLNEAFGGKFPITWSLGIILSVVTVSVVLSLLFPKKSKKAGGSAA
ncbi:MAG: TerC family protein [Candidatus Hydrogenedentes bacterium]|nr:TerC family protein [Candidatus Hydrogenedentota bacterium]